MNKVYTTTSVSLRLWFYTWLCFGIGGFVYSLWAEPGGALPIFLLCSAAAAVLSLPALFILLFTVYRINNLAMTQQEKLNRLLLLNFSIALLYGLPGGFILNVFNDYRGFYLTAAACTGVLFACTLVAFAINYKIIISYFASKENKEKNSVSNFKTQIKTYMETVTENQEAPEPQPVSNNKTWIKAIVTGVLILVMLIPTLFVSNLITEREERQKEVVQEVSSKWATPQTITGPWLYIPFTTNKTGDDGKIEKVPGHLFLLPENLSVNANMSPEERPRSIYKVLLYKSAVDAKGNFEFQLPKDIDTTSLQLSEAKICMGITDFKGIGEKIAINFNGNVIDLLPGLPTNDIDSSGLSAPVNLSVDDFGKSLVFNMSLKIKGSEQLHFVPLAGNSNFLVQSTWSNPSFDGNSLPGEREVSDKGFSAKWTFNNANLPFGTALTQFNFNKNNFAFGVSMVQPADQYAKTMRSIKYAVLFIGLTFCLFFIVELMQKKPFHPVQYILVGLALIIFFTLLLSISEFLLFNTAYLIASTATVLLISLYAKGHFKSWKTAGIFTLVLGSLYGFIFILITLEDTALLVGSIGLFVVLALVMYVSRKINWYNPSFHNTQPETI